LSSPTSAKRFSSRVSVPAGNPVLALIVAFFASGCNIDARVDIVIQLIPDNIERTFTALASLGYRPIVPIKMKQFSNSELRQSWIRDKADRPQDRADIAQLRARKDNDAGK
jgi:hypothetical protein